MALVAAVNFRGVGESVKANVVLTMVELSGLLLIIFIGLWAVTQGNADFSRVVVFESSDDRSVFFAVTAATSLAFFAMVGFEDSVNMAEECKDPVRDFPKMMLTGLGVTGTIYVLVSITAVALVPVGDLTDPDQGPGAHPGRRRRRTRPELRHDLPVHRHVRGGQLRADQHADGQPAALRPGQPGRAAADAGQGAPEPAYALGGDPLHDPDRLRADHLRGAGQRLGGRRHDRGPAWAAPRRCCCSASSPSSTSRCWCCAGSPSTTSTSGRPTFLPYLGAVACFFLAGPWARTSEQMMQYKIAGGLLAVGIVLWALTWMTNRGVRAKKTGFRDIEHMEDIDK